MSEQNSVNRRDFFTIGASAVVGAAVLEHMGIRPAEAQLLGNPRILSLQEAVVNLPTLPFPVKIVWVCFAYNVRSVDIGDMLIRINTGEMPAGLPQLPLAEALVDPRRRPAVEDSFFDVFADITDPNLPSPGPPFPSLDDLPRESTVQRSRSILCIRLRRGVEVFVWYCFFAWHSDCVLIKIDNKCLAFHVDGGPIG